MIRQEIDTRLYQAYLDVRKNLRNAKSSLDFEMDLESNLRELREELYHRRYIPSPPSCFIIEKPSKREVFAPAFRDRIVSHFLFNILYSLFDTLFIYDSFSCRKEKGTLFGIERFRKLVRSCTNNYTKKAYVLLLDISGYFMNINKNILLEEIYKQIDIHQKWNLDVNFVKWLTKVIVFKDSILDCIIKGRRDSWRGLPAHKSLFNSPSNKGLIIGDLMSLLFSNIYLNILDQFVKHTLKERYYCRYVDDSRIISTNKERLELLIPIITKFLKDRLDLDLNLNKTIIVSTFKPLEFLGVYVLMNKMYVKPLTIKNFIKCAKTITNLVDLNSYLGYLSHFRTDKVVNYVLDNIVKNNPYLYELSNMGLVSTSI